MRPTGSSAARFRDRSRNSFGRAALGSARHAVIATVLPAPIRVQIDVLERRHLRAHFDDRRAPAATSARDKRRRVALRRRRRAAPASVLRSPPPGSNAAHGRRGCAAGSPATRTISRPVVSRRRSAAGRSRASSRSCSTATRSASRSASSRLCVETRIAQPAARRSSSRRRTLRVISGSSPTSARRAAGSSARAAARAPARPSAASLSTARPRASTPWPVKLERRRSRDRWRARLGEAVERGVDAQVLADRQAIPEARRLGEKSDSRAECCRRRARQRHAVDGHATARRRDQPGEHPHRRRLAGAVRSEQRDDLGRRHVERHVVHDGAGSRSGGSGRARAEIMGGMGRTRNS